MLKNFIILLLFVLPFSSKAQKVNLSIGTDIPYQHYIGSSFLYKNFSISYKTGILVPPYSDAILEGIHKLGVDQIYIDLIQPAYQFGWMNTFNINYHFGKKKNWYIGPEYRIDKLNAQATPKILLESVTRQTFTPKFPQKNNELNIELGLNTYGVGFRFGKSFTLDEKKHHRINIELSASKNYQIKSVLIINDIENAELNKVVNELLWEEAFKSYGFIGGLGISYQFSF